MTKAISWISVGVADMRVVEDFWVRLLGLEIVGRRQGADSSLAALWNIAPEQIAEQLLLRTPGAESGRLHFVQFSNPDAPVRQGAAPTDLGPKNIDVNCVDMPERVKELTAAGYQFRSALSEYAVDDARAREVQMPGHDAVNIVFIEVLSGGVDVQFSDTGYAALTSFVVIVPDIGIEADFYQQIFELDEVMQHRLSGPEIEKVIGLPPGAALELRILGAGDNVFGRMEIIRYEGLAGADRFTGARPPALGILSCGFEVDSLKDLADRLSQNSFEIELEKAMRADTLMATGIFARLKSPAGLQIAVYEAN